MHSLSHSQHFPSDGTFVTIEGPSSTHCYHSESIVHFVVHSWLSMYVLGQSTLTWTHHYNTYRPFSLPWKSFVLHLFIPHSLPPQTLATTDLFTVSIVLLFQNVSSWNHTVGSLFRWLLSLRNVHLSFLHVFSWLDSSFIFSSLIEV